MSQFEQSNNAADPPPPSGAAIDPLIGRTLEGKYHLDALLGAGGMGTVYRATRLMIGDAVAIKILHAQQVAEPHAIERFRREAQAAARLKHQNAVAIYDFGVSNEGLVYLVMELAEGQSLRDILKQYTRVTPSAAAKIMSQVCAALDEAHRQNIVHRDLKPDNIIVAVTDTGLRAKVLDFGIAKMRDLTADSLTLTGSMMGTPYYMSPEHCLGEELDQRSDIYSLGVVIFEMLAGVVPFNAPAATAIVVAHVNQAPPSLRAINANLSPAVEAVVMRALEKRREARPQTSVQLAQELIAAVQGRPLTPHSGSMPVSALYSTPPTPAAKPSTGAGLAATIKMTTPPVISGARAAAAAKKRLPLMLGVAVATMIAAIVLAVLMWSQREKNATSAIIDGAVPAPPTGMAYVPGNEFTMGNDAGDEAERPQHKVTVKPFFIDLYEVTCEEYEKFIRATRRQQPATWTNSHYPSGWERRPVTGITWDDATAYAKWAGKRLPTEQEWEVAARGSDERLYPWGNEWKEGLANAGPTSLGQVAEVGTHSAGVSPFGALDMVGNVWEWTASDFDAYPGGRLPGQATGTLKVIRGGCFLSRPDQATTTIRVGWPARGGNEYDNTGFRCAKNLSAISQPVEMSMAPATPPPVDFQVANIIEGTISSFECGDNCYLTITDKNGKEHTGLCAAPICTKWGWGAMPDSYKGKRVQVTVGKGTRFDGAGNVADTSDAFTRIQFIEPESTLAQEIQTDACTFCGLWEYNEDTTKQYLKITKAGRDKFKLVEGIVYEGKINWLESWIRNANGIYLRPINGRLMGSFVSANFRATHGVEFTSVLSHMSLVSKLL